MRGKRRKNSAPLCSAYYHAMDVLHLPKLVDLKAAKERTQKWNNNYHELNAMNLLGFGDLTPWDDDNGESMSQEIESFAKCSREEYEKWMQCVKYQFNISTLIDVMPPKVSVSNFFKDIAVRIPNEKTLVVKEHGMFTVMVSMEEYSKNEKHNEVRDACIKSAGDKKVGAAYFDGHFNFEFDSWVKCNLTFSSNLNPEQLDRETLTPREIDALTGRKSVYFPFDFWLPIGNQITVERLDNLFPIPVPKQGISDAFRYWSQSQAVLYTHLYLPNRLEAAGVKSILNPQILEEAKKIIPPQYQNGEKEISKTYKNEEKKIRHMGITSSVWGCCDMVLNAVKSIGILFNPDFKEACVRTIKQGVIKPNFRHYNQDNPYKQLPKLKPKFEHYVVSLNIPDDVSNAPKARGNRKRMHLVRGHLMRSKGKNAVNGFVWRKSHWRGNKEVGVVTKDYIIDIQDEVKEIDMLGV